MRVFARLIKHPLNVSVQRLHDPDASKSWVSRFPMLGERHGSAVPVMPVRHDVYRTWAPHSVQTRRRPIVVQGKSWGRVSSRTSTMRRSQLAEHWMLQVRRRKRWREADLGEVLWDWLSLQFQFVFSTWRHLSKRSLLTIWKSTLHIASARCWNPKARWSPRQIC